MHLTITFSVVPKWQHRMFKTAQALSAAFLPHSVEMLAGSEIDLPTTLMLVFLWVLATDIAAGLPIAYDEGEDAS